MPWVRWLEQGVLTSQFWRGEIENPGMDLCEKKICGRLNMVEPRERHKTANLNTPFQGKRQS